MYQARQGKYDAVTVEEIKAQFQKQIETMLQSQERNTINNNVSVQTPGLRSGHIQTAAEKELNDIKDLQRGKSFLEARTAVQKQIERMFTDAQQPNIMKKDIKHTIHGVSHAIPGQGGEEIKPPPPVHYGVNQAIKKRAQQQEH